MKRIAFGTDGWRAVMAEDFTFDNVRIVAQAIAAYLLQKEIYRQGIVVGYDNRFLSEKFALAVAEVLAGNEIPVFLTERATPTPVVAFAVKHFQAAGAVMLTASHNPPEYNGIKFIPEYAGPAVPEVTRQIEEEVLRVLNTRDVRRLPEKDARDRGLIRPVEPMGAYIKHLSKLIDFKAIGGAGLAVVVDPLYGAGIGYLETILKKAGCRVEVIHGYRDPLFGGHLPDPNGNILAELRERVLETGADLGLALDGDADRFGVIDRDGSFYRPNQILYLLLVHLVKNKGWRGRVARTVATTHMLDRIAKKYGLEVEETPVGFKYIGQSLLHRGSILGGEESGGLSIRGHLPEKDGILANLLIVELVAVTGKSLQEITDEVGREVGLLISERLDLPVSPEEKERILQELRGWMPEEIGGQKVIRRVTVDGGKQIMADDSWVLIRPSGTEPLFRLYVEGNSEEQVRSIQQQVREMLRL
ncbi:phosphoglucomutase/phosphomannomutase family protein [Calderihabitans maritimus]|uniref:Phosphoglucomutase n=1 Tax=Calderihabitans maritimus TaxID=1246530 RepID=A0A1Z5HUE6_9FIRM|nr:phosphoglucomutase/phosphomannomutase family protein [Calderihabitans maritimus]GAW93144.1 phosphoglucomutase [Calderihabitans maritimus]